MEKDTDMKIELLNLTENEDGSADVDLELDDDAKKLLIQLGVEALLLRAIKTYEEESNES
jgi:hypothetical protein